MRKKLGIDPGSARAPRAVDGVPPSTLLSPEPEARAPLAARGARALPGGKSFTVKQSLGRLGGTNLSVESKLLIMTVEEVFQIEGRGTALSGTPGPQLHLARQGEPIELDSPTHGSIHAVVSRVEMWRGTFSPNRPRPVGILLAQPVPSEHLPKGTAVYYSGQVPTA